MSASDPVHPPAYRGFPYARVAVFVLLAISYREWFVDGLASARLINNWLYYAILVVGFYFVFGVSGQFAFSQAAFAGLGGFTSAWATRNDQPFIVGFLTALVVCGVVAAAFALVMRRSNHFYFAIGTLGLSEILLVTFRSWEDFTSSSGGYVTNVKPISIFGFALESDYRVFWVLLTVLAVTIAMGYAIARSPAHREAVANRDSPLVAATNGIPTLALRVKMLVLGSVIAGAAGSLLVHWNRGAQVETFGVELALGIFLMLTLGGIGSLWGAVLGAWFYVYIQDWLRNTDWVLFGHGVNEMWPILYGALLVIIMIVVPDGLIGLTKLLRGGSNRGPITNTTPTRLRALLGHRPQVASNAPSAERAAPNGDGNGLPSPTLGSPASIEWAAERPPIGGPILSAREISVSFGAVRAVDGVTLVLHTNEVLGLIGPNGSGKSSFLNALSGVVPARGQLLIEGSRHRALGRPARVRRAGVLRTFQTPQTFLHLTCIENVLLSTADRRATGLLAAWFLRPVMLRHERARRARAQAALERVGLAHLAEAPAAGLSYGQQRLLELARTIAGDPRVILLDEPSAGLNAHETAILAEHIIRLRDEGVACLLVDHKVDFINAVCDRVAVLELGTLVAEGEPRNIWTDQRVVDAYLGLEDLREEHATASASAAPWSTEA